MRLLLLLLLLYCSFVSALEVNKKKDDDCDIKLDTPFKNRPVVRILKEVTDLTKDNVAYSCLLKLIDVGMFICTEWHGLDGSSSIVAAVYDPKSRLIYLEEPEELIITKDKKIFKFPSDIKSISGKDSKMYKVLKINKKLVVVERQYYCTNAMDGGCDSYIRFATSNDLEGLNYSPNELLPNGKIAKKLKLIFTHLKNKSEIDGCPKFNDKKIKTYCPNLVD